ncbi:methionine ABC transporter permease [Brevibacillus porteri]|uniref:Methionine ABC transporter permease n=1 Tax=Brevibacillus porteri TaxID=2126350 RepID=A0ABX5FUM8_9BACL|nr:methionine ABC transporter permease [Brevibacillus porteri]MED1799276.1 ABC transporter permease [Brevibacillus porteri]MED2132336.1 ABC transporter permease [Brevibacillus porteri]MED2744420.1 ABC transporter permease [Brevibacillus porteri]MED2814864.1 ABC transporter permease [Brevibacillus porteri]MED2895691.1 ABC transporter permease [Brevibacillus porteri]
MEVTSDQVIQAVYETIYMVSVSLVFATMIGLPLGVLLVVTRKGHILENPLIFSILNPIINVLRSVPFIILLVAIIPLTRLIVGTSIGTTAAIVPLIIYSGPYMARLVENSLLEVNAGIIEAAEAMGATPLQIIFRFLIPETLGSIILSITTATIGLIGATAMAGAIGGGGIGDLAITYGYQRFSTMTIVATVVILVVLVQGIQSFGNVLARKIRRN